MAQSEAGEPTLRRKPQEGGGIGPGGVPSPRGTPGLGGVHTGDGEKEKGSWWEGPGT